MLTASQFAAHCLGLPIFPPFDGKLGQSPVCWLCGGDTYGLGWPLRAAIKPTFTNHNQAVAQHSDAICWQCVAMSYKETWDAYVARHPEMNLKTGKPISWRCYSHVFVQGLHECPTRERWRHWLVNPPLPPFLFVVATSGQKHLIFRARVAHAADVYPVQFEDDQFLVDRAALVGVFEIFEALYALGFSKDSILSGEYHHGQLLKVGMAAWKPLEDRMKTVRRTLPHLARLAHFCAQKPA
jgi:hypothetical protein